MEDQILNNQFYIVIVALSCGIISILTGGFGNIFMDKICYFIIASGVILISYYLIGIDRNKYRLKIISLTAFLLIYSVIINFLLIPFLIVVFLVVLLYPKNNYKSAPDITIDSPLKFSFRNLPIWKIILIFLYIIPLFMLE
ncbi:MAG: hypothetical protein KBG40_02420 [Bacteroidales bacterium]|nr:hypothetical protein [Bacteroidales bacterium]